VTPERWQKLERIYHAARELDADRRAAFLAEACAGDDELRSQIASLLAHGDRVSHREPDEAPSVALAPGALIGPYRIDDRLDAGGMGVVYRAMDTRLGRPVAIKIGYSQFSDRFHREARSIAALNHPHICTLHDIGSTPDIPSFLVLEFVEGATLAAELERGPVSIDRALHVARMIAMALVAAHARGIVHRDLKPANIKITSNGVVKVLDFGLAKEFPSATASDTTTAAGVTMTGAVIGTAAYMSPEQASGQDADARSDIFSFGAVLYEMATGTRPFKGGTSADTIASVIKDEPLPPRRVRPDIPAPLERIILKCLRKVPAERYDTSTTLLADLDAVVKRRSTTRSPLVWVSVATAAALLLIAGGYSAWHAYQLRWLERTAVPQIEKLLSTNRARAARKLYVQAERIAPDSKLLFKLAEGVAVQSDHRFETSVADATVYISDYAARAGDDLSDWEAVGTSPVTFSGLPRWGFYRVRAVKTGYAPVDMSFAGWTSEIRLELHAVNDVPSGMVWVPATAASTMTPSMALPGFWIDRFEVTNREFKTFVDAGGYRKPEYWKTEIVRNGKSVTLDQAMSEFHDLTGRVGPAGWSLGDYPEGAADHPVSGVSWHEAAAYAEFAGKSLPTVHEWRQATPHLGSGDIVALSNFSAKAAARVGAYAGMGAIGAYDLAGNVKEWIANTDGSGRRFSLGGAWDEPPYVFSHMDTRDPFTRTTTLGFRLVKRTTPLPEAAFQVFPPVNRALRDGPPVDDKTYREYVELHRYKTSEPESRVEHRDDANPYWVYEKVSFSAAYENDRVIAHIFLPRNAVPPYQAILVFGGTGINRITRVEDYMFPYQFLIRSGRAVVIPAFWGTLERGPSPSSLPEVDEQTRSRKFYFDLARTVDYLQTRSDIDKAKFGFYGISWGAQHAPRLLALDKRFSASVLVSGGLGRQPRSVDSWNFAPRYTVPTLMIHGESDAFFPVKTNMEVLFNALGTAKEHKQIQLFAGSHANPVTRPETLGLTIGWYERYLGRVLER
jgi:dienelactone hydrolase